MVVRSIDSFAVDGLWYRLQVDVSGDEQVLSVVGDLDQFYIGSRKKWENTYTKNDPGMATLSMIHELARLSVIDITHNSHNTIKFLLNMKYERQMDPRYNIASNDFVVFKDNTEQAHRVVKANDSEVCIMMSGRQHFISKVDIISVIKSSTIITL